MSKKLNKNASNDSGVRANISYGNMLDQERYMYVLGDAIESKVLDCACGIGWGSYLIACAGAKKVISIDLSNSAIKSAKKYYDHENIQYVKGDIFKLKFKNKFDLITSFETIEHLENPQKFLTILKGYSNKNTILYLSTPNGKVFKSKEKPENPYHVNEYTKDELIEIITNAGWIIKEYLGQYPINKNDKVKIQEYKSFIKRFWKDKKMIKKFGIGYQLFGKAQRRIVGKLLQDPAHDASCKPMVVKKNYEPAYHFFRLKLK